MLPGSQEMLEIVRSFIDSKYTALCSVNDMPFRANNVEVYPKSEGGYAVVLYKTKPEVGGDFDKIFEYNTEPESNKACMDFCKGLEKYINGLEDYKYFKFQVIPGRKLTKQVASFIIYPEHKFDKPEPADLEKFDIKELTKDSRIKQNESTESKKTSMKESYYSEDDLIDAFEQSQFMDPYDGINEYEPADWLDTSNEDDFVDDEGYDAGGAYVGAEDDAFVDDFLRDQARDDLFTESTLKEDAKDAAWGEGYKAVKQDEHESMRTPNPYEPGSDLYRYWQNGYKAGEDDLRGGYYNESKKFSLETVLKECDGGCSGGDCGGACDGAVTASDFAGQVPENMGAVVGPGKDDKKFSDVFGD